MREIWLEVRVNGLIVGLFKEDRLERATEMYETRVNLQAGKEVQLVKVELLKMTKV